MGLSNTLHNHHMMHEGLRMTSKVRSMLLATGFLAILAGRSTADTIVVDPSNPHGWTTIVTDATGGAEFVNGPATPPGGVGSLNLYTGNGTTGGDGAAMARNTNYDGLAISAITSLGYSTYVTSNNGQQAPYLTIWVHTDGGDDRRRPVSVFAVASRDLFAFGRGAGLQDVCSIGNRPEREPDRGSQRHPAGGRNGRHRAGDGRGATARFANG